MLPVALTLPPVVKFPPETLPVALISPLVMLPVVDTVFDPNAASNVVTLLLL